MSHSARTERWTTGTPPRPTAGGKGRITEVGAGYVVVGTRVLRVKPHTLPHGERSAASFEVGESVDWQAYPDADGRYVATWLAHQSREVLA